ncbi:hypothetical protein GCM10010193_38180 [Kitasatospora atroaurantiaca]|uniref:Uncharacterized protein n=1 Tax=Kitasatospora atroaurantiaca TaxID=285545 RepID=A0A561EUI8_9ACTN|nr:hypothetical protein [Kitasatospora atroaurantiaca]TWE19247.1 hypothetical protein FB465_4361 [Kitasatospora atroaurantiaca]
MRGVRWGTVAAVSAALAVVAGYLLDGARLVWAVAAVEVILVMAHVAWRFRSKAHVRTIGEGPDAAHCERCRRAQERLEMRSGSVGDAVRNQ